MTFPCEHRRTDDGLGVWIAKKNHFNSPARFCAAGEEREARGQNHCAPATSLAFWKGISSFCSVSIPSRSLLAVLASYQLREQATLARTLLLDNDLTDHLVVTVIL